MNRDYARQLDEHLESFSQRLPGWMQKAVCWLWQPGLQWVRIPAGLVLVLGGIVGFLPILGFWMVPLGLIVLAKDFPPLQPALVRLLDWVERKWPSRRQPASARAMPRNGGRR
jgi:hypothetical protein